MILNILSSSALVPVLSYRSAQDQSDTSKAGVAFSVVAEAILRDSVALGQLQALGEVLTAYVVAIPLALGFPWWAAAMAFVEERVGFCVHLGEAVSLQVAGS